MNSVTSMNDKMTELSRLYQLELQKQLAQGVATDLEAARELGRYAMSLGLETLDMARIHEIALVSLVLPTYSASASNSLIGRAGIFSPKPSLPSSRRTVARGRPMPTSTKSSRPSASAPSNSPTPLPS